MSDTDTTYEHFAKLPIEQMEYAMANFDSKYWLYAIMCGLE